MNKKSKSVLRPGWSKRGQRILISDAESNWRVLMVPLGGCYPYHLTQWFQLFWKYTGISILSNLLWVEIGSKILLVWKIEGKLTPNTSARATKLALNIWEVWNLIGIQLHVYAHLSLTVLEWRCPFSSFPLEIYPRCYTLDNGRNTSHLTVHVSVIIIKLNRFLIINIVWFQKIYTPPGGVGGGGRRGRKTQNCLNIIEPGMLNFQRNGWKFKQRNPC